LKLKTRSRRQAQQLVAQYCEENDDVGRKKTSWWIQNRYAMQFIGILGGAGLATNVLPSLSLMGSGGDGSGTGGGGDGGGGGNGGYNPIFDLAEDAEGYGFSTLTNTQVQYYSCEEYPESRGHNESHVLSIRKTRLML